MLTFRELLVVGLTLACGLLLDAWVEERMRDGIAAAIAEAAVFLSVFFVLRPPLRRLRATPGWWRLAPVGALVAGLIASTVLHAVEALLERRLPQPWPAALERLGVLALVIAGILTIAAFVVASMDAWRARLDAAERHPTG